MPKININAKMIGIEEPVEVFTSIYNHDLASKMSIKLKETNIKNLKYNLELAKQQELVEKSDKEDSQEELSELEELKIHLKNAQKSLEAEKEDQDFTNTAFEFIKEVLGLNAKQLKTARKSLDGEGLGAFTYYLISRVNEGPDYDPQIILDAEVDEDEDPKKG